MKQAESSKALAMTGMAQAMLRMKQAESSKALAMTGMAQAMT
jgi:hypothetical protein